MVLICISRVYWCWISFHGLFAIYIFLSWSAHSWLLVIMMGHFCVNLTGLRNALWENIISVMFVKLLSKDIFTWIAKKKKIVLLWMSITQSVGGLNRTKTWRKGRFAFSARAGTFIFSHSLVSELLIFRPSNSNWITPPAFLALRLAEGR